MFPWWERVKNTSKMVNKQMEVRGKKGEKLLVKERLSLNQQSLTKTSITNSFFLIDCIQKLQ